MTGPDNRVETNDRGKGVGHSVAAAGPGSDISAPSEALLDQARRAMRQDAVEELITILKSGTTTDKDLVSNQALIKAAKNLVKSSDKQAQLLGIDLIGAFGSLDDRKELSEILKDYELDDQTKIRIIGALAREVTNHFEHDMKELYESSEDKDHIAQYALFASDSKWRGGVQSQSASYKLGWILYNYFKNDYSDKPASSDNPPLIDDKRLEKISSLGQAKNPLVKESFLLSLAFAQSEASDPTLLKALTSGDSDTQELTLSAIIVAERLDLLPQIKEAVITGKIPLEYAIRAIYRLGDDESSDYMKQQIEGLLKHGSPDQRSKALQIYREYYDIMPKLVLTAENRHGDFKSV